MYTTPLVTISLDEYNDLKAGASVKRDEIATEALNFIVKSLHSNRGSQALGTLINELIGRGISLSIITPEMSGSADLRIVLRRITRP